MTQSVVHGPEQWHLWCFLETQKQPHPDPWNQNLQLNRPRWFTCTLTFERHCLHDQWGKVGAAEASGVCSKQHLVQTMGLSDGKGGRFMGACGEAAWAGDASIPSRASVQKRDTSYCSPRYGVVSSLFDSVFWNFKILIKSSLSNFFLLLLVLLVSHLRTHWKFQCHEDLALCFLLRA